MTEKEEARKKQIREIAWDVFSTSQVHRYKNEWSVGLGSDEVSLTELCVFSVLAGAIDLRVVSASYCGMDEVCVSWEED